MRRPEVAAAHAPQEALIIITLVRYMRKGHAYAPKGFRQGDADQMQNNTVSPDGDGRSFFLEAVKGDMPVRVPVFPRDLTLGLDVTGVPTTEVFGPPYDPCASAAAILALQSIVGNDAVVGCIFGCMVTGFGVGLGIPETGVPYPTDAPFREIASLDAASPDSVRDGMLAGMRESYRIVRNKRKDLAVVMNLAGPVTNGGNLRNMELLLMDMASDPDVAHRVMRFSAASIVSAMDYLGADLADALSWPPPPIIRTS